jgi:hypothetical protein
VTVERYTKLGRVVRLERDLRRTAIIRVDESGQSVLDAEMFEARPIEERGELAPPAVEDVEAMAARIAAMLHPPLVVERLLVTHGVARHRFECGEERNEWEESAARIHLSIAHPQRRLRALLDLGGTSFEELDLAEVRGTVNALLLPPRPAAAGPLRLAPNVAAALFSAMATLAPVEREGSFSLRQSGGGVDGRGRPIAELTLIGPRATAPMNVFRPSYRMRPAIAAFHVRAVVSSPRTTGTDSAEAVALLAPVSADGNEIAMTALVSHQGRSSVCEIRRSVEQWCDRVTGIDADERWYPLLAGVFGATMFME